MAYLTDFNGKRFPNDQLIRVRRYYHSTDTVKEFNVYCIWNAFKKEYEIRYASSDNVVENPEELTIVDASTQPEYSDGSIAEPGQICMIDGLPGYIYHISNGVVYIARGETNAYRGFSEFKQEATRIDNVLDNLYEKLKMIPCEYFGYKFDDVCPDICPGMNDNCQAAVAKDIIDQMFNVLNIQWQPGGIKDGE